MKFRPFLSTIFFKMHSHESAGAYNTDPLRDDVGGSTEHMYAEASGGVEVNHDTLRKTHATTGRESGNTSPDQGEDILVFTNATENPGDIVEIRKRLEELLRDDE